MLPFEMLPNIGNGKVIEVSPLYRALFPVPAPPLHPEVDLVTKALQITRDRMVLLDHQESNPKVKALMLDNVNEEEQNPEILMD